MTLFRSLAFFLLLLLLLLDVLFQKELLHFTGLLLAPIKQAPNAGRPVRHQCRMLAPHEQVQGLRNNRPMCVVVVRDQQLGPVHKPSAGDMMQRKQVLSHSVTPLLQELLFSGALHLFLVFFFRHRLNCYSSSLFFTFNCFLFSFMVVPLTSFSSFTVCNHCHCCIIDGDNAFFASSFTRTSREVKDAMGVIYQRYYFLFF